jgi:hypothetical protein
MLAVRREYHALRERLRVSAANGKHHCRAQCVRSAKSRTLGSTSMQQLENPARCQSNVTGFRSAVIPSALLAEYADAQSHHVVVIHPYCILTVHVILVTEGFSLPHFPFARVHVRGPALASRSETRTADIIFCNPCKHRPYCTSFLERIFELLGALSQRDPTPVCVGQNVGHTSF